MSFQLKIFIWFFSLVLFMPLEVLSQINQDSTIAMRYKKVEAEMAKKQQSKQKQLFERNLKFGWDVSNLLIGALSTPRKSLDFSIDYTIKKDFYGIVEIGKNNFKEVSDVMDYYSEGNYFRIGFDSDMRKNEKDVSRDIFYLGARYAYAKFKQRLENYQINSLYWPTVTENESDFTNSAHWAEAIAGFKVEVMKNIYLGLGLRIKFMIFQSGDKTIKPALFIPGYGKTSGTIIMGFNYNLYYNLPLNYSKKNPKRAN